MLIYDWMWRGHLTNQNLAQRCVEGCAEVHGGVYGGAWRCVEGCVAVHRNVQRCMEGCAKVVALATIDLVGDNREFEV